MLDIKLLLETQHCKECMSPVLAERFRQKREAARSPQPTPSGLAMALPLSGPSFLQRRMLAKNKNANSLGATFGLTSADRAKEANEQGVTAAVSNVKRNLV